MALVFNPFTGNFDNVMASSSDMSFSGGSLNVNGDLTLDSGGAFTTTVQAVTPTANRTISFPDQTGTVGLVSGATGNIQYNNAGQLAGTGDLNTELDWVSPTGTYTALKVNADSNGGNTGKLLDLQVDGTTQAYIDADGSLTGRAFGALYQAIRWNSIWAGGATLYDRIYAIASWGVNVAGFEGGIILHNKALGWSTGANNVVDLSISRDAADTLAQRRGTNAQTYRLYNTYTDVNNYQRTSITDDSTGLIIDQQYATDGGGPGAVRTNLLDLKNNGTSKLKVSQFGDITGTIASIASLGTIADLNHGYRIIHATGIIRVAGATGQYSFSPSSDSRDAADTGLKRDSAGVVAVTDGSTGLGTLQGQLRAQGTAPASSTDPGTIGDIRVAGTTLYVHNGSQWTRVTLDTTAF